MQIKKIASFMIFLGIIPFFMISCSKNFTSTKPKCLAVGSARSVMIKEVKGSPGIYKVIVKGSNPSIVLLTQRPKRSTRIVDTKDFLERWDQSYKSSAPNVTFTSVNSSRTTTNVLVLTNPQYDPDKNQISFDAESLSKGGENVETGIYNNVSITYDAQTQSMIYEPSS